MVLVSSGRTLSSCLTESVLRKAIRIPIGRLGTNSACHNETFISHVCAVTHFSFCAQAMVHWWHGCIGGILGISRRVHALYQVANRV
jgi:hypothetical protein